MKNWIWFIIFLIVGIAIIKQCEKEPIVETKYITKTDTITQTIIQEKPVLRYVERIKTEKGKDSIIYRDKPTDTTIEANQYDAVVKTDSSRADLKILTTGELLDVTGTITYNQKQTTIKKPQSGLFLYGEAGVIPNANTFGIGLDYQVKNSIIIGTSINYNTELKEPFVSIKLGFRIF